jgi:thiol-disulfide isomerase/thioredoxin
MRSSERNAREKNMTQASASVITFERFKKGKTFQEYLDSGIRNCEIFEDNYKGTTVSEAQQKALKGLVESKGLDHVVVIGEDWCPDVYRGMPVAAKIAEAAGIEMRVFERDQNKDMIAEYLKNGEFESIPVFVFYDKNHKELANFIERPQKANDEMHETRAVLGDTSPEGIAKQLGHEPNEDELNAAREAARERYLNWQRTSATWAGWRTATVDEVIRILT